MPLHAVSGTPVIRHRLLEVVALLGKLDNPALSTERFSFPVTDLPARKSIEPGGKCIAISTRSHGVYQLGFVEKTPRGEGFMICIDPSHVSTKDPERALILASGWCYRSGSMRSTVHWARTCFVPALLGSRNGTACVFILTKEAPDFRGVPRFRAAEDANRWLIWGDPLLLPTAQHPLTNPIEPR